MEKKRIMTGICVTIFIVMMLSPIGVLSGNLMSDADGITNQYIPDSMLMTSDDEPEEDEDDDDIDDETEEENDRTIDIEVSGDEIQVQTQSQGAEANSIQYKLGVEDEGLLIDFEFGDDDSGDGLEVEFRVVFSSIIEFTDTDADKIYNSSIDTTEQTYDLDNFDTPTYTSTVLPRGNLLYNINYSTSDDVFKLAFYISEEFVSLGGQVIKPTEMKMDIIIDDFPYTTPGTLLSVPLEIYSEVEGQEEDETEDELLGFAADETALNISMNDFSGFFSWSNSSIVDGSVETVHSSEIEEITGEDPGQRFYLNYKRGTVIIHDPKIGMSGLISGFGTGPPSPGNAPEIWIIILIIVISAVAIFSLVMTKGEYRKYLLNRILYINKGLHTLTMEEVLENNTRSRIIDLVIDNPGIHHNELLRQADVSASTLAWHLDILETYKIIHKQRVGQYLIYYPYLDKNPFAEFDPTLVKSKTTLDIYQLIGDNPGLYQSQIARRMDLDHKTVKYHLDKLVDAELIHSDNKIRKKGYYAVVPH